MRPSFLFNMTLAFHLPPSNFADVTAIWYKVATIIYVRLPFD